MNPNPEPNQDNYPAILAVWSILAASGVVLIDQQTFVLALALLVMIVIFTITRLFSYSSFISMLVGSGIYLAVYFSIFPFSFESLTTPGSVVLIFAATAGLGTMVMRKMNTNVGRLHTDLQLLSDLIQYDTETGLLLWQHACQKLDVELARCRRYQKNFSIIMLEPANTTYENLGVGNRKESNLRIAKLLLQTCRIDVDIPFTGHHFGVILPETDAEGSVEFAKRLLANSARKALLDLRISIACFPADGVTPEELIFACETALQVAVVSEQTIVRYDKIHESAESDAFSSNDSGSYPSELLTKKANNYLENLGPDESLLTFLEFHNMADLSLIQENLADIKEIEDVSMLEYSEGRLIFKLKSKANLSGEQFSDLRGLHIKAIRAVEKSIEIELDK